MNPRTLLVAASLLCLRAAPLLALGQTSWDLELDPYYSDVSFTVPFSSGADTAPVELAEMKTYGSMLVGAFVPRFLVLEASINPLPLAGAAFRGISERRYHQTQVSPSVNLIEAVTAGFQEPYALSLFLGKVVDFSPTKGKKTTKRTQKGYIGYLASVGNYHIMDSLLIPDYWLEAEWKVKGDLQTESRKLSWSFRGGLKSHAQPEIADTYYIGLRRDRVDYKKTPMSFLLSSGLDYRLDLDTRRLGAVSHFVLFEKNFPHPKRKWTFSLGLGYLWQRQDKYTGGLAQRRRSSESQVLFRPNIKF